MNLCFSNAKNNGYTYQKKSVYNENSGSSFETSAEMAQAAQIYSVLQYKSPSEETELQHNVKFC